MHIQWIESGFVGIDHAVTAWMKDLGQRVEDSAKGLAPVDTGALVSSIELEMEGKTAIISANTFYAIYQEEGTGPHEMTKDFYNIPGLGHPVHGPIDHPGNPAIHYLRTALYSAGG